MEGGMGGGVHLFSFPEFRVSGLIWQETLELVAKKKEEKKWSNYVIGL